MTKSLKILNDELIEKFGRMVAERFADALEKVDRALNVSEAPAHIGLRKFLAPLSPRERENRVAQVALECFVHDFMASLNESHDFRIMGRREDGIEVDLKELCPEGLHGNQIDWMEDYEGIKAVYSIIFENDSGEPA